MSGSADTVAGIMFSACGHDKLHLRFSLQAPSVGLKTPSALGRAQRAQAREIKVKSRLCFASAVMLMQHTTQRRRAPDPD
jgi:hypothetical protein